MIVWVPRLDRYACYQKFWSARIANYSLVDRGI